MKGLREENNSLREKNQLLENKISSLEFDINDLEQYGRRQNLEIGEVWDLSDKIHLILFYA